ncbi:hypothetical protein Droror1_Dr00012462 [Drosera rotundifolia]
MKPTLTTIITTLLLVSLLGEAKLNLDRSDHEALMIITQRLGHPHSFHTNPCSTSHGVTCDAKLSNHTSHLRITRLEFTSKFLRGSISPAIGRLTELQELSLGDNQITDRLPSEIVKCRRLEEIDLRENGFFGEVPEDLWKLVRLRVLDLSNNRFSGELSFLKQFPNLEVLKLSVNLFTGKVPVSLRSFRNLRVFDVSGNEYLEGPVPVLKEIGDDDADDESGQIRRKSVVPRRFMLDGSSRRNHSSAALAPKSSGGVSPISAPALAPSSSVTKKHHKKHKMGTWILGFLVGSVAGGLTGMIFSVLVKLLIVLVTGGGNDTGISIFSPLIKKEEDLAFLEKEDGVAAFEMIGKGGCGEVYRAQLPGEDGKMIAIKKVIQPPKEAAELVEEESRQLHKHLRQIRSEIKTVGQIRHRNLLPLLAHVSRPNCHYLVYEFMKNGSLQDAMTQVALGLRELDWPTRHRIALGIASGLEYLHMNNQAKIIHRDLKPANVLLDDDMEARITDFGLAKVMPEAITHVTSSNVAGTLGYIAPEYHQTLKFTDKCDIYSFGVLLAGLMTGKLPSDQFFQDVEEYMVKWVRNVMRSEDPTRAIDDKLLGNGQEQQMLQVLKIACFCTLDDPKQRPNSKEVGVMLSQINLA